jgi:hydrogenase large subunit
MAVAHYLEALEWQKEIVKIHTIFGGKNPHPNYLVGGVPCSINIDEANAINAERLAFVGQTLQRAKEFIEQVYIPDVLAVAPFYLDWAGIGGGLENYLCYGDLPTNGFADIKSFKFPRGAILGRNLNEVHAVDPKDDTGVQEFVDHSWYEYTQQGGLHPWKGETNLKYSGPKPPYEHLDVDKKYSWLKTPRWKGHAMEVGPLSRMLVGYAAGNDDIKGVVTDTLGALNAPASVLFSTLGRTAARAIESTLAAKWGLEFYRATPARSRRRSGSRRPGRRSRRASAAPRPRAARSRTGSSSTRARSRTTSWWFRAPGTPRRATARASAPPTRPR